MPLSEEELRLLEQMERALVEEDPKFASTLRGTTLRTTARRRAVLAGACFLVGIVMLMAGAVSELIWLGIAGFVVMLASATFGLTALRGQRTSPAPATPSSADPGSAAFTVIEGGRKSRTRRPRRQHDSFMERMEERWRRRREQGGGF